MRSDGVGAEWDSGCARLLECRAADGEGLRYRFRDGKIAARCPGVRATRSNARRFQIIANYSMSSLEQVHASGDRLGQAGGGGIKETEDQPHALAITIGENTSEQRKTGGRHSRGNQPGTPRKTAKLAHSGGITAPKGARLAMVGFRLGARALFLFWSDPDGREAVRGLGSTCLTPPLRASARSICRSRICERTAPRCLFSTMVACETCRISPRHAVRDKSTTCSKPAEARSVPHRRHTGLTHGPSLPTALELFLPPQPPPFPLT